MQGYRTLFQSARTRSISLAATIAVLFSVLAGCQSASNPPIDVDMNNTAQSTPGSDKSNSTSISNVIINADGTINEVELDGDDSDMTAAPKMNHSEDYERYRSMNPDVLGWISVPNTRIEYPVLHSMESNDYYLARTPEKNASKAGSIFLDFRNVDPQTDRHLVVYGHNMRSGSMFADLQSYKRDNFFNNNRDITIVWGDTPVHYEIYAASLVNTDTDFIRVNFSSDEEFLTYFNKLRGLSKWTPKPSVTLTKDDQILTLVTCTYEYDNTRWIVQAHRVNY